MRTTLVAAVAAGLLAGCQSAPSGGGAAAGGASPASLAEDREPVVAPSTTDLSRVEPTTPARTAKAQAYMECGLRAYYTAPRAISVEDAVDSCHAAMKDYQKVYFLEFGYDLTRTQTSDRTLRRRAIRELRARVQETGIREDV